MTQEIIKPFEDGDEEMFPSDDLFGTQLTDKTLFWGGVLGLISWAIVLGVGWLILKGLGWWV